MSRGRITAGVIAGLVGAMLALAPAAFADGHAGHGKAESSMVRGTVTAFTLPAAASTGGTSNGSMTVTESNGSSVTLAIAPNTSMQLSAAELAGLLAGGTGGQSVAVRVKGASGSQVAVAIRGLATNAGGQGEDHSASVSGVVYAVSSGTFTVQLGNGSTTTIQLSSTTAIKLGDKTGSANDITLGARVEVSGTAGSNGTFDASIVRVANEHSDKALTRLSGTVASPPSGSPAVFLLRTRAGTQVGVDLPAIAIIRVGDHLGTPQDIAQNAQVQVLGTQNTDGSFTATLVTVSKDSGNAGSSGDN